MGNLAQAEQIETNVRQRCRHLIGATRELLAHYGGDRRALRDILGALQQLRRDHWQRQHSRLSEKHYAQFSAEGERSTRRRRLRESIVLSAYVMLNESGNVDNRELPEFAPKPVGLRPRRRLTQGRVVSFSHSHKQYLRKGRPPNPHKWLMQAALTLAQDYVPKALGYSTVKEGTTQRAGPTIRFLRAASEFFRVEMSDDMLLTCLRSFRKQRR